MNKGSLSLFLHKVLKNKKNIYVRGRTFQKRFVSVFPVISLTKKIIYKPVSKIMCCIIVVIFNKMN